MDTKFLFIYFAILLPVFGVTNYQIIRCIRNVNEIAITLKNISEKRNNTPAVVFYLYNHIFTEEPIELNYTNLYELDQTLDTKIIVHGWMEGYTIKWVQKMKEKYLNHGDYNIILVDYSRFAKMPYDLATKKVNKIGSRIAKLVAAAKNYLDMNNVHLIGHSLGAHVSRNAADYLKKLLNEEKVNRITALDATGPSFRNATTFEGSATFVDVYHTSTKYFGIKKQIGTADYYVNGGAKQPHCKKKNRIENTSSSGLEFIDYVLSYVNKPCAKMVETVSCNHASSVWYWISSIDNEKTYPSNMGDVKIGENADPIVHGRIYVNKVHLEIE